MGTRRTFGSPRRLPSKRWQARYTGPDGQEHRAPATFQTKGDAEAWLAAEWASVQRDQWSPPGAAHRERVEKVTASGTTFAAYAQEVIDRRRANGKIRPTTAELYERLVRLYLNPAFGARPLRSITPREVQRWHAALAGTPTSRANSYGLLRSILAAAVSDELLDKNPARVEGGGTKRAAREAEVLTPSEVAQYFGAVPPAYRAALLLAFWAGLRNGEIRGIRRRDLDLSAGTVTVRQGVVKLGGRNVVSGMPKTDAGVRTVALPPHVLPALREWVAAQPLTGRDALLFYSPAGGPMSGEALRAAHKKGAAAVGRPGLRVHDLRHSAATLTAGAGATTAEMMRRFGWSTPSMAARYSHAAAARDRELAEKLSALS